MDFQDESISRRKDGSISKPAKNTTKSMLWIFSVVILMLGCLVLALFLFRQDKHCNHEYEVTILQQATWKEMGRARKVCKKCGDTLEEQLPVTDLPVKVTVTGKDVRYEKQDPLILPDGTEVFQADKAYLILEVFLENTSAQRLLAVNGELIVLVSDFAAILPLEFQGDILVGGSRLLTVEYPLGYSNSELLLRDLPLENIQISVNLTDIEVSD